MKKHQMKKINEMLNTIKEAQAAKLYAACQEGALSLCDFIEDIEGVDGAEAVALLVKYCELLFKASNGEISEKPLQKHLIKIENSINHKLKSNRFEIIFLSYKASMSDSIESIYLAAKADTDCDVYFIPIPYYSRNPDGSFGEMFYEGADCYSDNIKITDWQTYDIEAQRPDIIITFNPYDSNNYVTSVHPNFYCERLHNLTDMLVYIPYFVSDDTNLMPEHFVTAPGCIFAHKVIVQSEQICNDYISIFKKAYGNSFGKPEDKFIPLGSSKFDAVVNATREDFILPDGWCDIIGDKKVILYNTTIGALLQGNYQYLEKVRHVIQIFQERDDVVLWWRPHPLIKSTLQSMRPHLLAEYEQIADEYRRNSIGIYDDASDLHRAIAWADGYYGDFSSVFTLFNATNKPHLIQNIEIKQVQDLQGVHIHQSCLCWVGSFLWFINRVDNSLMRYNPVTQTSEFIAYPLDVEIWGGAAFIAMIECQGKLFIAPGAYKKIVIYDIEKDSFTFVSLRSNDEFWGNHGFTHCDFINIVAYNNQVYLVPFYYPAIVKLDIKTLQVEYIVDWYDSLKSHLRDINAGKISATCLAHNHILLLSATENVVIELNLDEGSHQLHKIGNYQQPWCAVAFDGEDYWLAGQNALIVKWNPSSGVIEEYTCFPDKFKKSVYDFSVLQFFEGELWIFPYNSNLVMTLNPKTRVFKMIHDFNKIEPLYQWVATNEHSIYSSGWRKSGMDCFSQGTLSRVDECCTQPFRSTSLMKNDDNISKYRHQEHISTDFYAFLCNVIIKESQDSSDNMNGLAGQRIYNYLRSTIKR